MNQLCLRMSSRKRIVLVCLQEQGWKTLSYEIVDG